MLADASAWLRARGIDQWPERFPAEWVQPAIDAGETWLAARGAAVVATLVVQWTDPLFWGDQPPTAGYLHRLAVREPGTGYGAELLQWAERHAAAAGRELLRLDCLSSNRRLRDYYERAGYVHRGDVTVGPFIESRYEKRVRTSR